MRSKRFITVVVIIIVFLIIGGFIVSSTGLKRKTTNITYLPSQKISLSYKVSPTPEALISRKPTPDIYGLEPPPLYKKLTWIRVPREKQKLSKPALVWSTPDSSSLHEIVLLGTEQEAEITIHSKAEEEALSSSDIAPLFTSYRNELLNRGWNGSSPSFTIDKYEFSVIGIWGADIFAEGFFKIKDNKVKIVNYSEETPMEY